MIVSIRCLLRLLSIYFNINQQKKGNIFQHTAKEMQIKLVNTKLLTKPSIKNKIYQVFNVPNRQSSNYYKEQEAML